MLRRFVSGWWTGLAATALMTTAYAAVPAKKPAQLEVKLDAAQQAAMAEMERLAAPGPAHEKLKAMEGKWKAAQKTWLAPGEPMVADGVAENRMILGGRFLEQHYQGTFQGRPYEAHGLTGYDNEKGAYTSSWIDTWSTSTMIGEGSVDAHDDLVMKSSGAGPDGKPAEFRTVTHRADANRTVFSLYVSSNGVEKLMMEITYTRM